MQTNWQSEILISAALTQSSHYRADKVPLALRDHYPELVSLFDRFDDMSSDLDGRPDQDAYDEAVGRADQVEALVDEASARFAQMRDMVEVLIAMDAAKPLNAELRQLSQKLDDAWMYLEQQR